MRFCNRCGKYLAVAVLSKAQGGETDGEGVCLTCARKIGITQADELLKRLGITDDDLEQIQRDMLKTLGENQSYAAGKDVPPQEVYNAANAMHQM